MRKLASGLFAIMCSLLILSFMASIDLAKAGGGVVFILGDGSVQPSDAPVFTSDNNTYFLTGNMSSYSDGIVVQRNNVVLDGVGYTIFGDGSGDGIDLIGTSNVTIRNVNIENFTCGVEIVNSSENTDAGDFGNIVSGNNITANYGDGVRVDYSANNKVNGNNISANGSHGIYFNYSENNSATGNNVTNNVEGVGLDYSSGNIIYGNSILANEGDGVTLGSSSANNMSANNITSNNAYGIHFDSSLNDTLSGNSIEANNWNGIRLDYSSNCYIIENNITTNVVYGVGLFSSSNNSISSNNVGKNGYGVGLDSFSDDNEILGNNITANYGHGIGLFASSNNTIFHNNLLDNSIQAYSTSDSANSWDDDYPSGGNYWSDYNGTDLRMGPFQNQSGSDGVGDTPYFIDSQNYDNFPLIGFFSDFNISSHADIQTVSNSTISNLKLNSTEIRFNATGQPNTTGFCRISLPTDINISQFIVLINGKQVAYTQLPGFDINETFLFLTYSYPPEEVPEFSSLLILTLFLVCAFFTAIIYRKKIC